jgi:diguanylate cyclase (GGDEF)-like protein
MGRARDNRIFLLEAEVSRYHARVDLVDPGEGGPEPLLTDLGSTNGTFLNGRHLGAKDGPVPLQHGDVIRLGTHAFKVKHLDDLERSYHETVRTQTTLDHLTGVGNRASVLAFLDKQAGLSRRHHRPLSVILCDLDYFKAVNDLHGHAAGDQALRAFSSLVAGRLRSCDHLGRIGGEEFLVVLPETLGADAVVLAEVLRKSVADEPMPVPGGTEVHLTCSFGVVQMDDLDVDGNALVARADGALYRAKGQGRNQVAFDGTP